MIKGNFPSIIVKNNTLIVSRVGELFYISEGIINLGGFSVFFENQTVNTDSISFPFRIGIEVEGLSTETYEVETYSITKAGKALEPADVASSYKVAPVPDDFSNLEIIPMAYTFDNREIKNPFKSLATVEKNGDSIIINQYTYGPLQFTPFHHSTYKDDYMAFSFPRMNPNGFYSSYFTLDDKLFLK